MHCSIARLYVLRRMTGEGAPRTSGGKKGKPSPRVDCNGAIVQIREAFASSVTLYVNDFNIPARKTYAQLGFEQHATFATVLF